MAAPIGRGQKRSNNNAHYPLVGGKKRALNPNDYRLLIPATLVPQVIGKQGANIKHVNSETKAVDDKARIMIYNEQLTGEPLMEGAADRVLGIKASPEAVEVAISLLIPLLQFPNESGRKVKSELRIMVPDHTCANVIGKGGENVKRIRGETKSFIQTYTVPLPYSEERLVRIQNFEDADLCKTAMQVWESIFKFKNEQPVILYEPIYFEQCAFDNTGSYIDTQYYQEAIASGTLGDSQYSGKSKGRGGRGGRGSFRGGAPKPFQQRNAPTEYPPANGGYGQESYGGYGQESYGGYGQESYGGYGQESYGSYEQDPSAYDPYAADPYAQDPYAQDANGEQAVDEEAEALAQGIALGMKRGMAVGMARGAAMARGGRGARGGLGALGGRGAPRGMPGAGGRGMRGPGHARGGRGIPRGRGGMSAPPVNGSGWENY